MIILLLIFLPIIISLLNYVVRTRYTSAIVVAVQLAVVVCCAWMFYIVRAEGGFVVFTGSVRELGIRLVLNHISSLFLFLTAFICTVVFMYTMTREAAHRLFVVLLFSVQSLMFIAFLSDDLFNIYLSLEISLLICSMLIMYKRESRQLYDGLVYLLTNIIGMSFFLFGVGYLYKMFGTISVSDLTTLIAQAENPRALALPYAMLMTGVCLKSAFVPLHGWLPKAHGTPGAPSVVSAILSGVFVKCGIYMFIRVREMFFGVINLDPLFLAVGIATGCVGIAFALCQLNFKKILAYHTVSQMGLILIGISLNSSYARNGAFMHIVNHALFKSLLFLCAGLIIKEYSTNNVYKISGVLRKMPAVGVSLLVGILGITGAPFFNGSISKYFIQAGASSLVAEIAIIVINAGTCLSFIKVGWMLLDGKANKKATAKPIGAKHIELGDLLAAAALAVLAASCLLTGIFGTQFMDFAFGYAVTINAASYALKAVVWLASIAAGVFVYTKIIKRLAFFKTEHSPELSFNTMSFLTLMFFGVLLVSALMLRL